ncbi:hypothetical protein CU052_00905 [Vibrio harveyi]|uniref:4'-phosphopantetheinyl transferase family protein n=1 Tax=Vibrio harveyi TaxID=669 RepID=UPI000C798BF0|nr:4'-phosphopantetheinyl transferase superfamily protein [Vibrio harveyi]AWA98045.1 hypothetical protein CU052_00905 [Vibrio harveyi]
MKVLKSTQLLANIVEVFVYNKEAPLVVWTKVPDYCDTTNLRAQISSQEKEIADRFHFRRDYNSFVVAHSLKRQLLSAIIGVEPSMLFFGKNSYGKPVLIPPQSMDIQFNLSHTNGLVVVSVAYQTKIGVDVEQVDSKIDTYSLACSYFAKQEIALLKSLPDDQKRDGFFQLWTLKEAFVKADGRGLSTRLDGFHVVDLKEKNYFFNKWGAKLTNWKAYSFQPTERHHLSVVTECRKGNKHVPTFHEISLGDIGK